MLIAVASLLAALAACGDPASPDPGVPDPLPEPITELPWALTASDEEVIRRSNAFGFELARRVAAGDPGGNIVLSPVSASMALGMTMNGAGGATFEAMRSTLAFDGLEQDDINASYLSLRQLLPAIDTTVELSLANAIFARDDLPVHKGFTDAMDEAFGAPVASRDFADPATLDEINAWADHNTNGRIPTMLDQLDPRLVMLLLNALWFDGRWTTEFDPEKTRRADFTRADGTTVEVDMMTIGGVEFPLGFGPGWTAAELPYGGQAWSMVVVVPEGRGSAREVFGRLDQALWNQILESLNLVEVDALSLPRFTIGYDTFLNDALKDMGMEIAFGPGADFSRMSPAGHQLCIDFVRQKTLVEVDEAGTRAAAVTVVGIGPTSFLGLQADRPFLFAIRERLTGTVLFLGLIEDPTVEDEPAEPAAGACHG